jgi:murein DD-endopeptidase MepM/ murein hydrolase activator NlpD
MGMRALLIALFLLIAAGLAAWQFGVIKLDFSNITLRGQSAPENKPGNFFQTVKTGTLEQIQAALQAQNRPDLSARDSYGQTPLMYAAAGNPNPLVIETLLKAGSDVNAHTDAGWTALMYAARDNSNPEVGLTLLQGGADPTMADGEGKRAVDHALDNGAMRRSAVFRILESFNGKAFNRQWPSGYIVPVQGARFSGRPSHLPNSPRAYRNGIHEGFDFYDGVSVVEIEYGTPVIATAPGVVVRADHSYVEMSIDEYNGIIDDAKSRAITPQETLDKLRGRQVWVEHPGGFISRYAHLSGIPAEITVGTRVAQGQIVGLSGNSGTIEGALGTQEDPHPHYELWRGDTYLGEGLEPNQIYVLVEQVFGPQSLPRFRE